MAIMRKPTDEQDYEAYLRKGGSAASPEAKPSKDVRFTLAIPAALCAELDREVNDRDWHVGLHLVFVDKAAHDAYQDDPAHVKFVEENKPGWAAVKVFDSLV